MLPGPVPRDGERALARFGLLGEGAAPVFTPGARYPLAGLLLALPALAGTGLIQAAREVYGRLTDGFYGLETMLVLLVFLALLREPRAEGATRVPPAALGRVLGLDRAPEVKTIRRKLGELAAAGKAAGLQLAIARHHAEARPDDLGFLYVDGHTRAYFGTRDVQKMHIARMKHPGPATEETWVTDGRGDPLLVVLAEPSSSLAAQIKTLLPQLRAVCGDGARPVLCFDRGGWSPDLFAHVLAAGFDLLTYRKAEAGKDLPAIPGGEFTTVTWTGDDGRERGYDLAETSIRLPVTSGEHKGEELTLRQVTRRDKDRQVHILTSRDAALLPAPAVIWRMTCRWREENYFRYARAHFALDALDSYATAPDDPDRKVPNPAKKTASAAVSAAKKDLAAAQAERESEARRAAQPGPRHHHGDHQRGPRQAGRPRRRSPPQAGRRPGHRQSRPRQDPAQPAQPRHGQAGRPDQADHPRHPDGRIQRRDHPGPRPERPLRPRRRRRLRPDPRSPHRQRRHHPRRRHPDHPARPAHRTAQNPRPRRPLRPAQRHRNPLSRHPARPALRDQRPPGHYINDLLCLESWGYTFRPRLAKSRTGHFFVSFSPAVSREALTRIRQEMRGWRIHRRSDMTFAEIIAFVNTRVAGWAAYYGRFYKSVLYAAFRGLNVYLMRWAMRKYKSLKHSRKKAWAWLESVEERAPELFAHWRFGATVSSH